MRRPAPYLLLAVMLLLLAVSCRKGGDNSGAGEAGDGAVTAHSEAMDYYNRVFLPEHSRIFRRVDLDMEPDAVRGMEDGGNLRLTGESPRHLQYEADLRTDSVRGSDYVDVKYVFDDQDRLDIVTVNYYIQDTALIHGLFDHLNQVFDSLYGDYYIDSDGYTVWESTYKRPDSTEVVFDIGMRKLVKLNDPGITIEVMRFGAL